MVTFFIFVGTISKILNRRITRKIERHNEVYNLKPTRVASDPFDLSLLSVHMHNNQRETGKQYEEAWSD